MRRHMWKISLLGVAVAATAAAQAPLPTPARPPSQAPSYTAAELDRIVSPIALYPDPLMAQVLAAATFPDDIADAASWADDHHYLSGNQLTEAIEADSLPWDPSVQALLPFPSVLEMMASDMAWTEELGDAFLAQHDQVMDAVQRMRHKAYTYGYLRPTATVLVRSGPFIEILPVDPAFIVVPYYDPAIVFAPHPPGFAVARGVYWDFGIRIGVWFAPWGWGGTRFVWSSHTVIINNAPWGRTWANRATYVHPYAVRRYARPTRVPERHPIRPRVPAERGRERPSRAEGDRRPADQGKADGGNRDRRPADGAKPDRGEGGRRRGDS